MTNGRIIARHQFFIGSDVIKEVSSFKYLEAYIDIRLKCNVQIKYIKSKISQPCGASIRSSKFLNYEAARNMYNSSIYSVRSLCIVVRGGVSQCISRCDGLKRIHKKLVIKMFSMFILFILFILSDKREISKLDHIYKWNVASYMLNILKHGKYPMLRSSLYKSYPSHNDHTRSSNEILIPCH